MSDAAGHFDHLPIDSPEFEAAHVYGVIRFTLDVWERYFGGEIPWHFGAEYDRLEVSILPDLDNARMGYGFLEAGYHHEEETGELAPFTLNFDVLAHEVGHAIIYSVVGLPDPGAEQGEYFGFHESAADLTALIAVLHFDSVIDRLLDNTRGNLDTYNELSRIGELSGNDQIRVADNTRRLSDFAAGWDDEHDLSEPLTGAAFDIFVDIYHELLLERGLISPAVEDLADQVEEDPAFEPVIQAVFEEAYDADPQGFRAALVDARDTLGAYLAGTWSRLDADYLSYDDVMDAMLDTDLELSGGRYASIIAVDMAWRDIGSATVGPRLPKKDKKKESHAQSVRTLVPGDAAPRARRRPSYRELWEMSRRSCRPAP
jgi:hypothetical protein